jgi:fatty acid desaturase
VGTAVSIAALSAVLTRPVLAGAVALLAILAVACGYRGLENLVHGASHDYMSRNRRINDLIGDLLFAAPVGQTVEAFRRTHLIDHHSSFGAAIDPCWRRMAQHADVAAGRLPGLAGTLARAPADALAFYRTAGVRPIALVWPLLWQAAFVYGPAALAVGPRKALFAYALVAPLSLLVILPLIRTFAESSEHDYADGPEGSVLERTFDNRGVINSAVHLFGDAMHLTHHLAPGVPQWRLRRLHDWLLANEQGYRRFARYRTSLMSEPIAYAAVESFASAPAAAFGVAANDNRLGPLVTGAEAKEAIDG